MQMTWVEFNIRHSCGRIQHLGMTVEHKHQLDSVRVTFIEVTRETCGAQCKHDQDL